MERISKGICLMGLFGKNTRMGGVEHWLMGGSWLSTLGVKNFCRTVELDAAHLTKKRVLPLIILFLKQAIFNRLRVSYLRAASGAVSLLIFVFNFLEVKQAKPSQEMLALKSENQNCTV
ncbi:hypothetical protein NG798_01790 [Ancylothrix sp. C2]|uniref:hypothetical protein n=1 Tax=Ancylothrix sp. D3o TaxID=2953691 RepID=UPI0021BBB2BC|nr:hypothetical protein [Ancylothrix sp. D3o]MCT7948513.1 hypothetical protein [Ancylothrix sp. D3o]